MTLHRAPPEFGPRTGHPCLELTPDGWLQASDAWLRMVLALPELALVAESCRAEAALHEALVEAPQRPVEARELAAIEDEDARTNHAAFVAFRDALLAAGSLQTWYLAQIRRPSVTAAPAFIAQVVQALVLGLLHGGTDAFEARAAELMFRPQRVSQVQGRLLCADLAVIDMLEETGGLGDLGRLLVQARAPLVAHELQVLTPDNAADYWVHADRHDHVLDLTHEIANDLGHGLSLRLAHTHSGLAALARVLQKWVLHLLGVRVRIVPLQRIDDAAWRWHIGLDVESMALLNDLYQDRPVEPARLAQLVSLFRLDFDDPADMRADVAGCPVYLGLARSAAGVLKLKPQNLLLNLPLAAPT